VVNHTDITSYSWNPPVQKDIPMNLGVGASVSELADRTLTGNTDINLSSVISDVPIEDDSFQYHPVYPNPSESSVILSFTMR